jgi:rod shape-determining protein MreC
VFFKLSQFKIFIRKVLIALVFISALAFMMLSKADTLVLDKTSGTISAVLSPIIKLMQLPGQLIYGGYEQVIDIANVYKENKLLKLENSELLMLKNKVRTLQAENKILADMLDYEQLPEAKFITAKVVAEEGDGFSHSLIVYIGDNKTIYKDQVAIGNGSVVGRVESVMDKYARVILITDIGSKIPVIVERSRERAILSGDNTRFPKLLYMNRNADVKIGDRIVTSGVAGVFPVGLPIGIVTKITKDDIQISTISSIERLEFLKIVDYGIYQDVVNLSKENKDK